MMPALSWTFVALLLAAKGLADDGPSVDETRDKDQRIQALIEEAVGWYELFPDAASKTPMRPQTALRRRNASRSTEKAEDILVLWIRDGRPEAAATIFPQGGYLCHEFASLSRAGRLVAKSGDKVVWSPCAAGAEFREVPDAPAPAETAAARLRQLKSMAERFKSTLTGLNADDSDREELRLLPRPLYRYELKDAKASYPDLHDGAVFAFVQGTDPEVLLVLEAVRQKDALRWEYGFARATAGGLEARLDGEVVWRAEKFPENREPTKAQTTLRCAGEVNHD